MRHLRPVRLRPFAPGFALILLPWTEYAIISVDDNGWGADLRRVHFDTQASDNPSHDWRLDLYAQA